MILLYFLVDCNNVFSLIMSCLFCHAAFSLIALITSIRCSFPFWCLAWLVFSGFHSFFLLVQGLWETFLFPHCQPLYEDDKLHHLSVTAVTNNHRLGGLRQHKLLIYYAVGQRSTRVSLVKTKACTPGSCRGESFSLPHLASCGHSHSQAHASFLQHQNQKCWADSWSLCHQTGTTAWKDSLTWRIYMIRLGPPR